MSIPRTPFVLAAVVLISAGGLAHADEPSRTFESANLRWTLPSEKWSFEDLPDDQKKHGYVAMATRKGAAIQMYALVQETDGLALSARADEMLAQARDELERVGKAKVEGAKLSGLPAKVALVEGKAAGGADAHMRSYVTERGGRFYMLLVRTWHGDHGHYAREIDAVRRGLRLIEGAGPEEAPAAEGGPAGTEEAGGAGTGTEGLSRPSNWPDGGPPWEDGVIRFPSHNLRWNLPTGIPFHVRGVIDDEKAEAGIFVLLASNATVPAPEEDQASQPACTFGLEIQPRPPGSTAGELLDNPNLQGALVEQIGTALPGRTRKEESAQIGNVEGAALHMPGKSGDQYVTGSMYAVTLKTELYLIFVYCRGDRDPERPYQDAIDALLAGLEWPETAERVAGPLAGAHRLSREDRGHSIGKASTLRAPGVEMEKPLRFGKIVGTQDPSVAFAVETRSEDGDAYLYMAVRAWDKQQFRQQYEEEDIVKKRAADWMAQAGASARTSERSGRDPWKNDRWDRARGVGYRFEGDMNGVPFVERGWVVTYKRHVYWIQVQFGGEGAEQKMEDAFEEIEDAWEWER